MKKALLVLAFAALCLLACRVDYSSVLGAPEQKFTLFQFIAPAAGGLFGAFAGGFAAAGALLADYALNGATFEPLLFLRLAPAFLAAYYFGAKNKFVLLAPLLAILLFVTHPEGGQAWVYSLFWIVPFAAWRFKSNRLARALGATFTAHAAGSVIFLYAFNIPATVWLALIPVTLAERLVFAGGIALSALALDALASRLPGTWGLQPSKARQ
jgi:uncharacterized membrane protein YccF (DUF307 family)